MLGKIARDYYVGKNGKRLNCAQAVAEACLREKPLEGLSPEFFAGAGGGKAPQEYCGAVYAAVTIAGKTDPDRALIIKDFFMNKAGGLTCREIRKKNKLPCADCVEKAADFSG